jgi:hypothetical protein
MYLCALCPRGHATGRCAWSEKTVVRGSGPSARMPLRGWFRKSFRALAWVPGLQEGEGLEQEEGPADCTFIIPEALANDGPAHRQGLVQPEKERACVLQAFEGKIQDSGEPGFKSGPKHRSFEDEARGWVAGHAQPGSGAVPHAHKAHRTTPPGVGHPGTVHASSEGGSPDLDPCADDSGTHRPA